MGSLKLDPVTAGGTAPLDGACLRSLEKVSMVLGLSLNKEKGVPLSYSLIKPRTARIQRTVLCVPELLGGHSWDLAWGFLPLSLSLPRPSF